MRFKFPTRRSPRPASPPAPVPAPAVWPLDPNAVTVKRDGKGFTQSYDFTASAPCGEQHSPHPLLVSRPQAALRPRRTTGD